MRVFSLSVGNGLNQTSAILLYDTIITYENEFQLLWQRKIGIVALLHVFNRYTRILAYVSSVALFPKLSDNVSHNNHPVLQ